MAALVDIRKQWLGGVRPAVTTVFVAGLASVDWLVEIEAVAAATQPTRLPCSTEGTAHGLIR
jgi:enamine deaminase RidA (YjgF/YER057c/UK114 family)